MALDPIPYVVDASGDASAAPDGSIPIALYGADSGGSTVPTFTELEGAVAGATGANLQAILNDIVTRLEAAETP